MFIWDTGNDLNFYGFPFRAEGGSAQEASSIVGLKVALHLPDNVRCERATIERRILPQDERDLREVISRHVPLLDGPIVNTATCMYTTFSDGNFLIDWHPDSGKKVLLCSPCSGHGFKFSSVVGEILQELVQEGSTRNDISLFSLNNRDPLESVIGR